MKSVKIRTCNVFHFCCNVRRNYFCHHFICIIICHSEMEASQQWRRICSQVSLENVGQGQPANVDSFWDTPVLVTDDGNKMCWWQFYISVRISLYRHKQSQFIFIGINKMLTCHQHLNCHHWNVMTMSPTSCWSYLVKSCHMTYVT